MIFWKITLIILINFNFAKCQQSCSDIAYYYSDFYGIYGRVEISHVPLQHNTLFEIELSVAARLQSTNGWHPILLNTNIEDDLLNDRKIIFIFNPLITNPLPVVTGVFLNGYRICSNPPARGWYVTTMKLGFKHTFLSNPQYVPTNSNTWSKQNPSWYYQNQKTTKRLRSPTRPTQPPNTSTLPSVPHQQTTKLDVDNKFGNINESYVCGVQKTHKSAVSLVIGGQKAMKNEFPWLTAFYYKEDGIVCGGTLVSPKIIVTAAHCVKEKKSIETKRADASVFYIGKYNLNDSNEKNYNVANVKQFIIHPQWDSLEDRYTGDIALALIYKTIKYTDNIIPLCIPPQRNNHEDLTGKKGLVAGWGITENGTISDVPMLLSLPVVNDGECLRSDEVFSKIISSSSFCVGDKSGRSPCRGDSGSAFAVKNDADNKYYFRGIVSSGVSSFTYTCDGSKYTTFTDVAQYADWIKSYIATHG